MDHTGQCSFCLDPVPSTNAIIYGENKKIYQDIFECGKRYLGKEISGRDSFDWGQSEVLLSPFCPLCFKIAHRIHQTQQELKKIEDNLKQLVKKFKNEVKVRASKNAEKISVPDEIEEDNYAYVKQEIIVGGFEQSDVDSFSEEVDAFPEEIDNFSIIHSEKEIDPSENKPNYISHPENEQSGAAKIAEDSGVVPNQTTAVKWPKVVLERLKFDENGKVLNPYVKRTNAENNIDDSSGRRKRKSAIKAASNLKKIIKYLDPNDRLSEIPPIERNLSQPISISQQSISTPLYNSPLVYIVVENEPDGLLYCDICGRPCDFQAGLLKHRLSHNGEHEKPIKCPTCGKGFNSSTNARRHSVVHENEKSHECKTCGKHFKTGHLKEHLESHKKDLPFGCVQCGRRFKLRKALIMHKAIHDGKVYPCGVCSKIFKLKPSLERHTLQFHKEQGEKISCRVCGKKYDKEYMLIHEACHESIIKCPVCSMILKDKQGLQSHMKHRHSERLFNCNSCDKSFSTKAILQHHFERVHDANECKCQTCGKILKNRLSLKQHLSQVHPEKLLSCEICGKQFRARKTLRQHVDTVHSKNLRFTCATCGKSFGISGNLKRHEELHKTDTDRTKFKCEICEDKYFPQMVMLVAHQKQFHTVFTNGPITCHKCGNKFEDSSAWFNHSRKVATIHRLKCSFCKDLFNNRCTLLVHSAEAHSSEDLPHKCEICNIVFNGALALKKHASSKHGIKMVVKYDRKNRTREILHQCDICGKIKKTAKGLKTHISLHSRPGDVDCGVCDKKIKSDYLKRHMETVHSEEIAICSLCGNSFGSRSSLSRHEKRCQKGLLVRKSPLQIKLEKRDGNYKGYKCKFCDKYFRIPEWLRRHTRKHTGEKPYTCEICGKCFSRTGSLKNHARTHTGENHVKTHKGEKPFTCDVCGMAFSLRSNLKRHMLTHTGEKPHKCTFCDKSFADPDVLKNHLRLHTGEKPYSCAVCSKAFSDRSSFHKHKKSHEGHVNNVDLKCFSNLVS